MVTAPKSVHITPAQEREGYEVDYGAPRQRMAYSSAYVGSLPGTYIAVEPFWKRPATEAQMGLLMFGSGAIWATKVETITFANILQLLATPGPVALSGIGLLVWLHAKWRRSVRVK